MSISFYVYKVIAQMYFTYD